MSVEIPLLPLTGEVAFQRVQPPARQVEMARLRRLIEPRHGQLGTGEIDDYPGNPGLALLEKPKRFIVMVRYCPGGRLVT